EQILLLPELFRTYILGQRGNCFQRAQLHVRSVGAGLPDAPQQDRYAVGNVERADGPAKKNSPLKLDFLEPFLFLGLVRVHLVLEVLLEELDERSTNFGIAPELVILGIRAAE